MDNTAKLWDANTGVQFVHMFMFVCVRARAFLRVFFCFSSMMFIFPLTFVGGESGWEDVAKDERKRGIGGGTERVREAVTEPSERCAPQNVVN